MRVKQDLHDAVVQQVLTEAAELTQEEGTAAYHQTALMALTVVEFRRIANALERMLAALAELGREER